MLRRSSKYIRSDFSLHNTSRELLFLATPCCNTSLATWSTPSESPDTKPFFEVFLWFSALFGPGCCCCQLVCFEFGVLHFCLPLYTRNGQVGEHVLLLWGLALILAGCCCQLVCFGFLLCFIAVCLYLQRADCRRTRTYREETKKTLPRHVAPRGACSCKCANSAILKAIF